MNYLEIGLTVLIIYSAVQPAEISRQLFRIHMLVQIEFRLKYPNINLRNAYKGTIEKLEDTL